MRLLKFIGVDFYGYMVERTLINFLVYGWPLWLLEFFMWVKLVSFLKVTFFTVVDMSVEYILAIV